MKREFKLIINYYNLALKSIQDNKLNEAKDIIFNMPLDLYDMSLDIKDYSNVNDEYLQLKQLINIVDNFINKDIDNNNYNPDILDDFNNLY